MRKPLGAAVVGGMPASTLRALVTVPIVYVLLARFAGEPEPARLEAKGPAGSPTLAGASEPA